MNVSDSSWALIQVHTDKVYDWFRYVGYLRWAQLFGSVYVQSALIHRGNLPSLKLTANAPENGRLEYDCFLLGSRPILRG